MILNIITSNKNKAKELSELLNIKVNAINLELPEIQSLDVRQVAQHKAAEAFRQIGAPVIIDDTGMSINAWNGLPGALIAWFLESVGTQGILDMTSNLADRDAIISTALAFADESGVKIFSGELRGKIAKTRKGKNGFGYDEIFIPDGSNLTLAEMTFAEKNKISMRKLAAEKLRKYLESI